MLARYDVYDEASFQIALLYVKDNATKVGLSQIQSARFLTAASELARNILKYAERGAIEIYQVSRHGQQGIKLLATDNGPGISDIDLAMSEKFSSSGTLGQGLPGAKRLVDEFSLTSSDEGTNVSIISWCE